MGVTVGANITCPHCAISFLVRRASTEVQCPVCGHTFTFALGIVPCTNAQSQPIDPRVSFAPSFEQVWRKKAAHIAKAGERS